MSPFHRWTRLPVFLVLLSVVFVLNCGSDDEDSEGCNIPSISYGPAAGCDPDTHYQQGTFQFTAVQPIVDGCGGGLLIPEIEGKQFDIALPAPATLPSVITVNVPFVGNVEVTFIQDGNEIKFIGTLADNINNPYPPPQTFYVEATVVGSICFDTPGSPKAQLALVVEAMSPGVFAPCCVVTVSLTGQLLP